MGAAADLNLPCAERAVPVLRHPGEGPLDETWREVRNGTDGRVGILVSAPGASSRPLHESVQGRSIEDDSLPW
ncbi:unnamed protein product [Lampetra fluviatilis]